MNGRFHFQMAAVVLAGVSLLAAGRMCAQSATVTAQVEMGGIKSAKKNGGQQDLSGVVIWLTPADGQAAAAGDPRHATPTITQQNKSFTPHVLVVQVGTSVLFPNKDRFLHNVFSLHDGRQFDLGFYEAGSAKTVRFDRPGVSFLFCNIHPEMTAAVIAVETPYFATSDSAGKLSIAGVAEGKYTLHVWAEQSFPEELKALEKEVNVTGTEFSLGSIRLSSNPNFTTAHKNKYGQDYVPPISGEYGHP